MGIKLPFQVPLLLMYHLQQLFTGQEIKTTRATQSVAYPLAVTEGRTDGSVTISLRNFVGEVIIIASTSTMVIMDITEA